HGKAIVRAAGPAEPRRRIGRVARGSWSLCLHGARNGTRGPSTPAVARLKEQRGRSGPRTARTTSADLETGLPDLDEFPSRARPLDARVLSAEHRAAGRLHLTSCRSHRGARVRVRWSRRWRRWRLLAPGRLDKERPY